MAGRIATLLQGEGGPTDARGGHNAEIAPVGRVGATGLLEEVLDLVDVVAGFRLAGARESCAHPTILPYVA